MGEPILKNSGVQFQPGQSGNPAGKPKGALDRRTREVRGVALKLVTRRDYLRRVKQQLDDGTLHPTLQQMLWYYAYGKPKETIEYHGDPLIAFQQLVVETLESQNGHAIELEADENGNGNGSDNGSNGNGSDST